MVGHPRAFTPSREDPAVLDARTVGRARVLDNLRRAILTAANSDNRPHVLLIGPRGAGKSHLIEVALYRLRNDPAVVDRLAIARLPEDAVGIASAADVMVEVVRSLDERGEVLRDATRARREQGLVALQSMVHELLGGRTLLMVIENLDRVMSAIDEAGQHELRAWVERSGEVMLLASAPLLFQAVQARTAPWFGSFEVVHLQPLTIEEGADVVAGLALERGDEAMAEFVRTSRGQARLAAIHHLAGGSPRIWTIFAACVDLEQLDQLVPAAESLLEELVPYYQQRLWELPPTEQKVLNTLALTVSSATVSQIADAAGVQRDTTASTLGRLAEAGWVKRRKAFGTDQRESWYELAEPLLRHHLQYRDTRGAELHLIVELLQVWFDRARRRALLLDSPDRSLQQSYLAATLEGERGRRFDDAYADRDIAALASEAQLWLRAGDDGPIGSVALGRLVHDIVDAVPVDADEIDKQRFIGSRLSRAELPPGDPAEHALTMIAACWNGFDDPAAAAASLRELSLLDLRPELSRAIHDEYAFWLGRSGDVGGALSESRQLVVDLEAIMGARAPQTASALLETAQLVVRAQMLRSTSTETTDVEPFELLRLVAFEGDARAYAALPLELRNLLDPANLRTGSGDAIETSG